MACRERMVWRRTNGEKDLQGGERKEKERKGGGEGDNLLRSIVLLSQPSAASGSHRKSLQPTSNPLVQSPSAPTLSFSFTPPPTRIPTNHLPMSSYGTRRSSLAQVGTHPPSHTRARADPLSPHSVAGFGSLPHPPSARAVRLSLPRAESVLSSEPSLVEYRQGQASLVRQDAPPVEQPWRERSLAISPRVGSQHGTGSFGEHLPGSAVRGGGRHGTAGAQVAQGEGANVRVRFIYLFYPPGCRSEWLIVLSSSGVSAAARSTGIRPASPSIDGYVSVLTRLFLP